MPASHERQMLLKHRRRKTRKSIYCVCVCVSDVMRELYCRCLIAMDGNMKKKSLEEINIQLYRSIYRVCRSVYDILRMCMCIFRNGGASKSVFLSKSVERVEAIGDFSKIERSK